MVGFPNRKHNLITAFINKKLEFQVQFFSVFLYLCIFVSRPANPALFAYNPSSFNHEQCDQSNRLIFSALYMCHNTSAPGDSLCNSTLTGKSLSNQVWHVQPFLNERMVEGSAKSCQMTAFGWQIGWGPPLHTYRSYLFLLWPLLFTGATGRLGLIR